MIKIRNHPMAALLVVAALATILARAQRPVTAAEAGAAEEAAAVAKALRAGN